MWKLRQDQRRIGLNLRNETVHDMIETGSPVNLLWRDVGGNVSTLRLSTEWHRRNRVYWEIAITLTLGTCIRGGTLHNPLLEVPTAQMLMMMIESKQNFLESHNFQNFGRVARQNQQNEETENILELDACSTSD
jgi:hypothetical protein